MGAREVGDGLRIRMRVRTIRGNFTELCRAGLSIP